MAKVNIIGSGIGGLATAVRLANSGFSVTVFESNSVPGGKLSEITLGKYRFDKGPTLFTLPELVTELGELCNTKLEFEYAKQDLICNYFYEDGTVVKAGSEPEVFAQEVSEQLGEDKQVVLKHLNYAKQLYDYTAELFLFQSINKPLNFFNFKTLKALANISKLQLSKTMHEVNVKTFKNQKTVQLFNRYATYNGSDPYRAPAILNVIPHLEHNLGSFMPKNGMQDITDYVYNLAVSKGVRFMFNHKVEQILVDENTTKGVIANGVKFESKIVVSNADINMVYGKLLKPDFSPNKLLSQEKSSSAYIFYWGVKKEFPELSMQNVMFSNNYKEEFKHLFESDSPYHDPTVYIHISSKVCNGDAPMGCENWFVMINVPHNGSHSPVNYGAELKQNVIKKINRILKTDIEPLIECEEILDPFTIEKTTSSFGGSLYGNSSNNRYSAFLRHSNSGNSVKALYFCGGSVHPGGGIPLCLLSAKIASDMIVKKYLV